MDSKNKTHLYSQIGFYYHIKELKIIVFSLTAILMMFIIVIINSFFVDIEIVTIPKKIIKVNFKI